MEWSGVEWNEWNGIGDGVEWNGMEWNGMESNGIEWKSGMESTGVDE